MSGMIALAVLILGALAWVRLGRVEDPEQELELPGPGSSARLIEAELRRTPGLSRREAAKRVLRSLRRESQ